MHRVLRLQANLKHVFSSSHHPILTIPAGSTVIVETNDASDNQLRIGCSITEYDRSRALPATGPIAIEGAEPGDVLTVDIVQIELPPDGHMWVRPGLGPFAKGSETVVLRVTIEPEGVRFSSNLVLPIRPMIGIAAVAPAGAPVPTRQPGPHGGNLDCTLIAPGNQLRLPVFTAGALLYLGDVHAVMGAGEVGGTGVEVPAVVTVRVGLIKGDPILRPQVVTKDEHLFLADGADLDEALAVAVQDALNASMTRSNLSHAEALMLLSAVADARVLQVVNQRCGVAIAVPKAALCAANVGMIPADRVEVYPAY